MGQVVAVGYPNRAAKFLSDAFVIEKRIVAARAEAQGAVQ